MPWTKYQTQVYKMYTKINSIISKFTKLKRYNIHGIIMHGSF